MRRTPTLAVLAALTTTPSLPAQPAEPAPKLATLVEQLGSPDYRTREKAARHLSQLGDRALPTLKAALANNPDPETARRLDVLIRKLDTERLTTARRVTLKGTNLSVKAVLAEIGKQSGYAIRTDGTGDESARYTFDLTDVPFWQALDRVCDAAGLTVNLHDDDGKVVVYFTDSHSPFVAYAGPFRFAAVNVGMNQNLTLSNMPRGRSFVREPGYVGVTLHILSEPKAPLVGVGQVEVLKAVDDTGASLVPPAEANGVPGHTSYYSPQQSYRSFNQTAGVNLTRSNRGAIEIKELRAKVPVLVLSESRPDVVIPDLASAKGKRATGREVDIEVTSVTDQNGTLAVNLLLTRRGGHPDDYSWLNGLTQRIEVSDEKGRKWILSSVDQNNSGPNVSTMGLQFTPTSDKPAGNPVKLVLVEWVTVMKEVEFTIKNIPLP